MTAIRAAAMLAALLVSSPAHAQSQRGCQAEVQPPKKSALGGLFAAARNAAAAQGLSPVFGASREGQAAAALLSGDVSGAVAAIPGARRDARTAQLTGVAAGMAAGMARSGRDAQADACGSAEAWTDETPAAATEEWR